MTTQEKNNQNGTGPSAEELRQHARDLLNNRQETLQSQIQTMLNEHRERLEEAKRSLITEFEHGKDESTTKKSISALLNREESGSDH